MEVLRNTRASEHLDFIRGVAALSVLLGHLRSALFITYDELHAPSLFVKVCYFFSGFGGESVMIFFVLSGFLIASNVYREIKQDTFLWYNYLINRMVRLYVVLVPALVFSMLITYFGYVVFLHYSVYPKIDFLCFCSNMLFLQTITADTYAGNGPLWSLSNEFWYYLLFPLFAMGLIRRQSVSNMVIFLGLAISVLCFIGPDKSFCFLLWLLGFLIYLMKPMKFFHVNIQARKASIGFFFLALVSESALSHLHVAPAKVRDSLTAICFAVFLFIILHDTRLSKKKVYFELSSRISSCSYTLYLIHYPILKLLEASLVSHWEVDIKHALYGMVVFVVIVLFAYGFSRVTEARTREVKTMLLSLGRTSSRLFSPLFKRIFSTS